MVNNILRSQLLKRVASGHEYNKAKASGFTLIEMLVVLVIVGVLAAIVGPSWVAFTNRQKINSTTNKIFTVLRGAQSQARKTNQPKAMKLDLRSSTQKITDEQGRTIDVESGVKILSLTNTIQGTGECVNVHFVAFDEKGTPFEVTPPATRIPGDCDLNLSQTRLRANIPIQIKLKHDLIGQEQCVTIRTLLGSVDTNCAL